MAASTPTRDPGFPTVTGYQAAASGTQWTAALGANAQQNTRAAVATDAPTLTGSPASPTYQWALIDPAGVDRVALFTGSSTAADPGGWTPDMLGNWIEVVTVTSGGVSQSTSRVVQVGADPVWTTINVGGGESSQDTNSTLSASNSGAGTFTIADVTAAQPQVRRRDLWSLSHLDLTGFVELVVHCTYTTKPALNSRVQHGCVIMSGTTDASILGGGGAGFHDATLISAMRYSSATADVTGSGNAGSGVGGWVVRFLIQNGSVYYVSARLLDGAGTYLAAASENVISAPASISSGYIAIVVGLEASGAGAQACEATHRYQLIRGAL